MARDSMPGWRRHLTPDEQIEVAALDRAIDMHRELMAPLIEARRRMTKLGSARMWKAGAQQQQSDAA